MQLLLGSSSKYRAQLLRQLNLSFEQASPDIDETPYPSETAQQLAARLSVEKSEALSEKYNNHLIITSDQVACIQETSTILNKPENSQNAVKQLMKCSGKRVDFYTALTLFAPNHAQPKVTTVDIFSVTFRQLQKSEIKQYVALEKPFDCAGSFKVEGLGITLFESMSGNDYNSLIGLPLISLCKSLRKFGINPLNMQ